MGEVVRPYHTAAVVPGRYEVLVEPDDVPEVA